MIIKANIMFKNGKNLKSIFFSLMMTFFFFSEIKGQEFNNYSEILLNAIKKDNDYNDDFATREFKIYKTGLIKVTETSFTLLTFTKYVLEKGDKKIYEKEYALKDFADYILKKSANLDNQKIVEILNNYLQKRNYLELLSNLWNIDFWIFDYDSNDGSYGLSIFKRDIKEYQKKLLIVAKFLEGTTERDEKLKTHISSISFKDFYNEMFDYFDADIPTQIKSLFLIELLDFFEKIGCTELNDAYWEDEEGPSKIPIKHRRRDFLLKLYGSEQTYIDVKTDSVKTKCLDLPNSRIKFNCYKLLNFFNLDDYKEIEEHSNEFELYKIGDSILLKRKINEWDRQNIEYFKTLDKMKLSSQELLKYENYEKELKKSDYKKIDLISKIDKYLNAIYLGNPEKFANIINEVLEVGNWPVLPPNEDSDEFLYYPNEIIQEIYEDKLSDINKDYISTPKDSVLFMSFVENYNLIEDYVKIDSSQLFLQVLNTLFRYVNNLISIHKKDFEKYLTQNHKILTQNSKVITSNSIMDEVHNNIVNGKTGGLRLSGMIFYTGTYYDRGPSRLFFAGVNTISFQGAYIDFVSKKRIDVQVNGKIDVVSKYNYKVTTPDIGEFILQLKQDECGEVKLLARGKQRNLWNFVFDVN